MYLSDMEPLKVPCVSPRSLSHQDCLGDLVRLGWESQKRFHTFIWFTAPLRGGQTTWATTHICNSCSFGGSIAWNEEENLADWLARNRKRNSYPSAGFITTKTNNGATLNLCSLGVLRYFPTFSVLPVLLWIRTVNFFFPTQNLLRSTSRCQSSLPPFGSLHSPFVFPTVSEPHQGLLANRDACSQV